MATRKKQNPADFIVPININGLQGRMLRMPAINKKKREMLLVYGHHASIERLFGLAEEFNRYGAVTMPDLPGFGGMDSFYKIHKKPTLDNLADYLAAIIKLRYKRKKVTIVGMSFGSLVVTRMLQKYPDLTKKVDILVSLVGFAHKDDFKFKRRDYLLLRWTASVFSNKIPALFAQHIALRPANIRLAYKMVEHKNIKLMDTDEEERKKRVDFEIILWRESDIRTYMDTGISMLTADLCNKRVKLPIYHIAIDDDRYFNNQIVEQHLAVIYEKVHVIHTNMKGHAPTVIADAEAVAPFVPSKLRRLLSKS